MKKYLFNENINALEIDPDYLSEGLSCAERKKYTAIRIIDLNHRSGGFIDLNLMPLSNSRIIHSLSIADNFKIASAKIDAMYTLENLISLSIGDKKIKPDFSKLHQLKALYIKHDKMLTNLSPLINLEHLLISSVCSNDCSFIKDLKSLKILRLSGGSLKNLTGVEMLSKLVELRIDHCPKLEIISSISQLLNLEILYVEKCKMIHDYSFLSGNSSIKSLFISDLDSISFVGNMKALSFLHFWNLKDGDLNPILKSETLKNVQFYPSKRNYSHTLSEITNQLRQGRH